MAAIDAAVGHESGEPVATRLRARAMLLVLDNFEHLQAGAHVLSELIATSPHLTLLVTSRVPLHLTDERVLYVDGLELPTDPTELDRADASALFLQEAHRADVDFELPEAERPYVVKLCRALAGFPLALVLAARWAAVLPCSAMVDELARGLDLLATTEADLPERHRSVTAILDATLARLPTEERALAHSLAMASCAPEAQSGIMHGRVPSDVLPRVRLLREQALVWVDSARGTLQLHPLLRSYVRTQHTRQPAPMWAA